MNKLFEIIFKKNSFFCNKGVFIKLNLNIFYLEIKYYIIKIFKLILVV